MNKFIRFGSVTFLLLVIYVGCDQLNSPEFIEENEHTSSEEKVVHVKVLDKEIEGDLLAKSQNEFVRLVRFPAEEKRWLEMEADTAYARDVLAGADTYISDATDGETWNVEFIVPDSNNTIIPGRELTFHKNYNGQEDCFVSSFVLCGSKSIYLQWYIEVQGESTGEWQVDLFNNGESYATKQFYLKPRIPPGKVPNGPKYNQGTYSSTPYANICKGPIINGRHEPVPCDDTYDEPFTIQTKGCYLTSGADILAYHGVNVDIEDLNTWLTNNGGYTKKGNILPAKIAEYARNVKGKDISYLGTNFTTTDNDRLNEYIFKYGPQMIGTKLNSEGNPRHFVTAKGRDVNETTYLLNDPDGGLNTTLDANPEYANNWRGIRAFSGPEYTVTNNSNLNIRFYSPGELVLTDPEGRRVGLDPTTGNNYDEIPRSGYAVQGLANDTKPALDSGNDPSLFHEIEIMQPADGDYKLEVIGTGTGTYSLDIFSMGSDFDDTIKSFSDISISPDVTHTYKFSYSQDAGSKTSIDGGYDGGGQRPRDVNKFLSYASPSQRQTTLPSGTKTFSLHVFYGNKTNPGSFAAELNRKDITSQFNPVPGSNEIVTLDLTNGRSTLVLSIDGQLPKRTANDKDRLVIKVQ